ncbi:hypothetical protein M9H77_01906 [Catharanthus roseus]|uniref:Uncharacterized protein n=1 Tax=Catharanthus roseus TaxID=4058 RepID=A0ACC0C709_CATRO|nr:hypothetical protein M9H77_01906 [Catharanthus roseus]
MTDVQDDPLGPIGAMWDGPVLAVEVLSYPRDEYIRWYRDITRVYIGNPANRDTRTVGYWPAGVDRRMMFCKESANYHSEVHGIYCRYLGLHSILARYSIDISSTAIASPSSEPVPDRGARGVKRGAHRLPGGGARRSRPPAPLDLGRGHADPSHGEEMGEGSGGRGLGDLRSSYQVELFDSLDLGIPSFSLGLTPPTQSHPPISYAPPAPYTVGSSIQHMPIFIASSSDSDEHDDEPTDMVTSAQQLGFGHRVGKKTTRFTPSDWP